MSNNWYSSSWTGGASGNSSSCYNDYNQCEVYEYGGENFSIGNSVGHFIGNRDGFNLGYGATQNNSNSRRIYEPRYGDGAIGNNTETYSEYFRRGYEQRHGDNASSNDRSNYRENYGQRYGENPRSNDSLNYPQRSSHRENYEQRYGEDARCNNSSNCRENYEQRYGVNIRSNSSANYFDNFSRGFKPSFGDNVKGSLCEINYNGNNRERHNVHERRTDIDWIGHYYSGDRASGSDGQNKVGESYSSKKSIQESEVLKSEKVKTEPYQNAYEDYNEKNMKKESDHVKDHVDITKVFKEIKKEKKKKKIKEFYDRKKEKKKKQMMSTKEKVNAKDNVDIKKESKERRKKRIKEYFERKKEKKKKQRKLKKAKARERNEDKDKAIFDKEVTAVTRLDQYACLKPECLQTFQVWGDARRHMKQGCLPITKTEKGKKSWKFTVKPNMGQSREKAQNQRGMGTPMLKRVADENEEKLIEAARNFYARKQNLSQYPHPKQVARHLRETYGGFGLHPARIHQIVKSLSKP